jgi:hypothetical protein
LARSLRRLDAATALLATVLRPAPLTWRAGGILAGAFSPDIKVGWKGLKKINFAADVQTGKNILGAWGFGSYFFFADNVSLLVGPVFYFDKNLQPGGKKVLWTAQIDVDVPLGRK